MTTAYQDRHILSVNAQRAKDTQQKERELPLYGKTYGYPPSIRHGSTTHTHMAYDFSLLPQCWRKGKDRLNLNCEVWFFYPESSSFPWSLRSAAQSSDRQFFSNQVWRGNSKVHSSYDLMLSVHCKHQLCARTRGQYCVGVGANRWIFLYPERPQSLLYLISLSVSQRMASGFRLNYERKQVKRWGSM